MSFAIPATGSWPSSIYSGLVPTAYIRGGDSATSGPAAILVADRYVRAHSMRTILSDGQEIDPTSTYSTILETSSYISEEGQGLEMLWDGVAASGTTSIRVTLTYASSGLTDVTTDTNTSSTRTIRQKALVSTNYTSGRVAIKVEALNTSVNGTYYGVTIQETSLTSI